MAQGKDTLREIAEQFDTWSGLIEDTELLEQDVQSNFAVREYDDVLFVGAGSSYHLATAAAAAFRRITGEMAHAWPASELLFFHEYLLKEERKYLVVFFSRSGRTTETLEAFSVLRQRYRMASVGITCDPASPLSSTVDLPFPVKNCVEQSLIMTKSFTSMLLLSYLFAAAYGDKFTYMNYLEHLPQEGRMAFEMNRRVVDDLLKTRDPDRATFLGGGPFLGLAREGALKLDEMALYRTPAMTPLEMRHGPKASVGAGDLIVLLMSNTMRAHEMALLDELRGQGASAFVLADKREKDFDYLAEAVVLTGRGMSEDIRGILYMPFLQYLGCQAALKRGLDPDEPANLTRIVTL